MDATLLNGGAPDGARVPSLRLGTFISLLISLYQKSIRYLFPPSCRFHPSCSDFAREAVLAHGTARGLVLAAGRLLRCHPFHPGGVDPVPSRTPHG